jgi:hypothetical protein
MPDSISIAMRYRDRADECQQLAELTRNVSGAADVSGHYRRIAEHYIALAEAEEMLAGKQPPPSVLHATPS